MRTKTLALSALLGLLGSASLMAQSTNVYSVNDVGYINVAIGTGFNMITCPLIASPDNTIGTLFPNGGGGQPTSNQYSGWSIFQFNLTKNGYNSDTAAAKAANTAGHVNGWTAGGIIPINPGQGVWLDNPGAPRTVTFVGVVPQNGSVNNENQGTGLGYLTNVLTPGLNLVGSALPMDGDLFVNTNTLMIGATQGGFVLQDDSVIRYNQAGQTYYSTDVYTTKNHWASGVQDPTTASLTEGFWYDVFGGANETWVENFSPATQQ
jgi:hypothetical protein